ncbi:hypothetical protein ACFFV7_35205 [Nonomuraea spiralis]|uniref:Lipoprotein n=1 Tax=Nonomuraea spiralis TaxID=46182 RepID=A0ABV5IPR1_9ACTN|nr:hypothetical protein [Nonomuraea spiralis]
MTRLLASVPVLLVAGCGTAGGVPVPREDRTSAPAAAPRVDPATAEQAFSLLRQLDGARKRRDCAAVRDLTTWAERTLGGRACEATGNGRPARPADPDYLLPDEGDWFAALAREPSPAYYLFFLEDGRWRLGAGPVPVPGEPVRKAGDAPSSLVRQARLVPQRHLTYLTDPAGVAGVRFPPGDPLRALLKDVTGRGADVELYGTRTLAVPVDAGSVLVFDALRLTYKGGRTDLVETATLVGAGNKLRTLGLRRARAS